MKELQSVGAPFSIQRSSIGSTCAYFSESHLFPFPNSDNANPPTGELTLNRDGSGKEDLSQDTPAEITIKLAALNSVLRDERLMMRNQGQAFPGIPYQNLNALRPSQLQSYQLNHIGPMFNKPDRHSPHISSYMKLATSEGMIHHDSPSNRQLPRNMCRPPFQ
ncbi:hypothetical protein KIW84_033532 [Lathyrus oleraceus]|uniref:Uncharacterized protein n=1 Tax=Pisum sativum TaxID=3888 RepID=A0A9D4XYT3_PEA|nr:hypothetical protein KIW84_033532 [Pisum sativum]